MRLGVKHATLSTRTCPRWAKLLELKKDSSKAFSAYTPTAHESSFPAEGFVCGQPGNCTSCFWANYAQKWAAAMTQQGHGGKLIISLICGSLDSEVSDPDSVSFITLGREIIRTVWDVKWNGVSNVPYITHVAVTGPQHLKHLKDRHELED